MLLPELMDEPEYKDSLRASVTTVLSFLHMRLDDVKTQGKHAGWYQGIISTGLPDDKNISLSCDEMMSKISDFL